MLTFEYQIIKDMSNEQIQQMLGKVNILYRVYQVSSSLTFRNFSLVRTFESEIQAEIFILSTGHNFSSSLTIIKEYERK